MAHPERIHQMLATVDAMDARAFARWFTPSATLRYGSGEPIVGREGIESFAAQFFGAILALRHRVLHEWDHGERLICQGECTYTRKDQRQVTLPFMTLSTWEGAQMSEYLVYLDGAPLFAP